MAASMGNFAGGNISEFKPSTLSHRSANASTSRPGGRFGNPVHNPAAQEPWDQISDDQRTEIVDCFQLFDMNKDDLLDFSEFRYALQALGFSDKPRQELIGAFKTRAAPRVDWRPLPQIPNQPSPSQTPGVVDMRISRESFQSLAASWVLARDPREEIIRTFALFDKDGKGIITFEDLRRVVKELGEDVPDHELRSMIEQFDIEEKGGVNRDEFLNIFLSG